MELAHGGGVSAGRTLILKRQKESMTHLGIRSANARRMAPYGLAIALLHEELRELRVQGALVVLFSDWYGIDDSAVGCTTFQNRVHWELVARRLLKSQYSHIFSTRGRDFTYHPIRRIMLERIACASCLHLLSDASAADRIATRTVVERVVRQLYLIIRQIPRIAYSLANFWQVVAIINKCGEGVGDVDSCCASWAARVRSESCEEMNGSRMIGSRWIDTGASVYIQERTRKSCNEGRTNAKNEQPCGRSHYEIVRMHAGLEVMSEVLLNLDQKNLRFK